MFDEDPKDDEQDYYLRGQYDALHSPAITALLEAAKRASDNAGVAYTAPNRYAVEYLVPLEAAVADVEKERGE